MGTEKPKLMIIIMMASDISMTDTLQYIKKKDQTGSNLTQLGTTKTLAVLSMRSVLDCPSTSSTRIHAPHMKPSGGHWIYTPPHGPMSSNGSLYARLDPVAVSVRWDFYQRWVTGISHSRHYSEKTVLAGYWCQQWLQLMSFRLPTLLVPATIITGGHRHHRSTPTTTVTGRYR
jgi:hypothetical protein